MSSVCRALLPGDSLRFSWEDAKSMAADEYERMLEAFAVAKSFLKQQVELGFDEVYTQVKAKKKSTHPASLDDFYGKIKK